jgi:hypothetical protein
MTALQSREVILRPSLRRITPPARPATKNFAVGVTRAAGRGEPGGAGLPAGMVPLSEADTVWPTWQGVRDLSTEPYWTDRMRFETLRHRIAWGKGE